MTNVWLARDGIVLSGAGRQTRSRLGIETLEMLFGRFYSAGWLEITIWWDFQTNLYEVWSYEQVLRRSLIVLRIKFLYLQVEKIRI